MLLTFVPIRWLCPFPFLHVWQSRGAAITHTHFFPTLGLMIFSLYTHYIMHNIYIFLCTMLFRFVSFFFCARLRMWRFSFHHYFTTSFLFSFYFIFCFRCSFFFFFSLPPAQLDPSSVHASNVYIIHMVCSAQRGRDVLKCCVFWMEYDGIMESLLFAGFMVENFINPNCVIRNADGCCCFHCRRVCVYLCNCQFFTSSSSFSSKEGFYQSKQFFFCFVFNDYASSVDAVLVFFCSQYDNMNLQKRIKITKWDKHTHTQPNQLL